MFEVIVIGRNSCPAVSSTMFPPTYKCGYCCVPFVSLHQLASPPGLKVTQIPKGSLVLLCTCVLFFGLWAFFSLSTAGLFSCSRLRGRQGTRRKTRAKVWALIYIRGTCSEGSWSHVHTGRHSEYVGSSQTHANPRTD